MIPHLKGIAQGAIHHITMAHSECESDPKLAMYHIEHATKLVQELSYEVFRMTYVSGNPTNQGETK